MNKLLVDKLGLKKGDQFFYCGDLDYFKTLKAKPEDYELTEDLTEDSCDFIHFFCRSQREVISRFIELKSYLKKDGMMWVSWPKASSPITTDLKREWIREYILGHGLVDVKVASINDIWSGLKFVYRIKDR